MVWRVELTATATKQLSKRGRVESARITAFLHDRATATDPRSTGKRLTGPLGGLWRYRVGNYRVIREIEHGLMRDLAFTVSHWSDVPGEPRAQTVDRVARLEH